MQESSVAEEVKAFIASEFLEGDDRGLEKSSPLLEWGIIDSVGMVSLLAFLEERFGVRISESEITPTNFRDLASISAMVRTFSSRAPTTSAENDTDDPELAALRDFGATIGYVDVSTGARLHHIEMPGANPPWILIPEPGEAATFYGDVQRALEGEFRSKAVDLAGFGMSEAATSAPGFWDQANLLVEYLQKETCDRLVLVGHGLGAGLALEVATRLASRTSAVVALGFDPTSDLRGLTAETSVASYLAVRGARSAFGHFRREALERRLGSEAYARFVDESVCQRIAKVVEEIRCPTLWLGSLEDRLVPPHRIEAVAARVPSAETKWLARVGHAFPSERADETVSLVLEWVKRVVAGAGS